MHNDNRIFCRMCAVPGVWIPHSHTHIHTLIQFYFYFLFVQRSTVISLVFLVHPLDPLYFVSLVSPITLVSHSSTRSLRRKGRSRTHEDTNTSVYLGRRCWHRRSFRLRGRSSRRQKERSKKINFYLYIYFLPKFILSLSLPSYFVFVQSPGCPHSITHRTQDGHTHTVLPSHTGVSFGLPYSPTPYTTSHITLVCESARFSLSLVSSQLHSLSRSSSTSSRSRQQQAAIPLSP